ncbi:peptidoglycan recognition protein family protein [Nocardiopsis xinjiangensis]|uniref:peptidoglycan recognition protein family protein n=1 Tax=Nocardiopsis xinjiangensis TaxID=124285 RepID=UPI0003488462|nr:peptidoglycan-binding domain-containing protein [Nocardiopsis xinjiangensis]
MPQPDKLQWRSDLGWSPNSPAAWADPKSGLVVHYDSSDQNLANKTHSACEAYWDSTRNFHTGPSRGWVDIGYSWGSCAHGYVMEGRGLYRAQAAQPGGNTSHYSVTLMTGPTDTITDDQINAVRQLRAWLMEPDTSISGTVLGHRDFIATSCPGDRAYRMVQDGTFTGAPGAPTNGGDDPMIGLEKGDSGEAVKALQVLIGYAGQDLPEYGVDGDYGDETAEGLRQVRASVGSEAGAGWGDTVTGYAYAQLMRAVARAEAEQPDS